MKQAANAHAGVLLILLSALVGGLFFGPNLDKTVTLEPVKPVSAAETTAEPVVLKQTRRPVVRAAVSLPPAKPIRLKVPSLGIDAPLISVGQQADGSMTVPSGENLAGWYNQAPTPGEIGPAILVGHVHTPTKPAVFWRLRELTKGDTIEINRADSKKVKFRVDAIKQFPQNDLPTQEIFGNLKYAGIRLITCGGTYDPSTKSYSHNTVVFASMISESPPKAPKPKSPMGIDKALKHPASKPFLLRSI